MDSGSLLVGLKSENSVYVKDLLKSVDSSMWPVETLIPFVLKEALRSPKNHTDLIYIEKCFRMFTALRRLQELQKREAVELHKMSLLIESISAMLKYKNVNDVDKLGDYVMRKFQLIVIPFPVL
ncbi:hypothetical protein COOONC_02471 [Cooperia oncophora]